MAPPFIRVNKSRGAKNLMAGSVYVDATSVNEAIEAIEASVSGPGLMFFLEHYVSPYFEDQIVDTFAGHGEAGVPGGSWPPLAESTLRIRHGMGFMDDEAWNERSGELLEYVVKTREYFMLLDGAEMQIPGDTNDAVLEKKLRTAQEGSADNTLFPGAYTPPRPVLAVDEVDLAAVTAMLHTHVMTFASNRMAAIGDHGP